MRAEQTQKQELTSLGDKHMTVDFQGYIPCWETLYEAERNLIAENTSVRNYRAGEYFLVNQPKKDGMIMVLRGSVRVLINSAGGREITLFHIQKGEVFCIMTIDRAKANDVIPSIQVLEDALIAYIPRYVLETIAYRSPEMGIFIFDKAAEVAQAIINRCAYYFFNTLRGCIATLLLERAGSRREVTITHEEIANSLGTTRVVISRELEQLSECGLLETRRGRILILDREGLSAVAAGDE